METISVKRDILIQAPREQVWEAVTTASDMEQWWGDQWAYSARSVGGTITFGHGDDAYYATITRFDAPSHFVFEWLGSKEFPPMTTEFSLTEENGGTRVRVRDSGFEKIGDDLRQQRIEQTDEGYRVVLQALKDYVEGQPASGS